MTDLLGRISVFLSAMVIVLCMGTGLAVAAPAPTFVDAGAWSAYKARFLDRSGRIVDTANGGISHSEGQGYGMLLSSLAGDLPSFEAIWTFTRTQMLLRDDGLVAWKWDPNRSPHVTDINDATDGDILIAYALARASARWHRNDFRQAATAIIDALARHAVVRHEGHRLLLPAAAGFGAKDRSDGPVVNLSYWIFEAFPVFAELDPDDGWNNIGRDGRILLANAQFSPRQLPPDWLSLRGAPALAKGFPAEFGYNAIRIPLYLIRGKTDDRAMLRRLLNGMSDGQGDPVTVNLASGEVESRLTDPGYRAITALARCVLDKTPLPADVRRFSPTDYYPSTLHLLALATVAEQKLKCGG